MSDAVATIERTSQASAPAEMKAAWHRRIADGAEDLHRMAYGRLYRIARKHGRAMAWQEPEQWNPEYHAKAMRVLQTVAAHHGIFVWHIVGPCRFREIVRVRQSAALALYACGFNFAQIGGILHRHESSVRASLRRAGVPVGPPLKAAGGQAIDDTKTHKPQLTGR